MCRCVGFPRSSAIGWNIPNLIPDQDMGLMLVQFRVVLFRFSYSCHVLLVFCHAGAHWICWLRLETCRALKSAGISRNGRKRLQGKGSLRDHRRFLRLPEVFFSHLIKGNLCYSPYRLLLTWKRKYPCGTLIIVIFVSLTLMLFWFSYSMRCAHQKCFSCWYKKNRRIVILVLCENCKFSHVSYENSCEVLVALTT